MTLRRPAFSVAGTTISNSCDWYSLRLPTKGWPGWVDPGWLVTYRDKCTAPRIELGQGHPSQSTGARRTLTSLIETNALPLRQTSQSGVSVCLFAQKLTNWLLITNWCNVLEVITVWLHFTSNLKSYSSNLIDNQSVRDIDSPRSKRCEGTRVSDWSSTHAALFWVLTLMAARRFVLPEDTV